MGGGAVDVVMLDCDRLGGGEVGEKGLRWSLGCDVCEERFSSGSEG